MNKRHYDFDRLKRAREKANLTQKQIGDKIGASEVTIQRADKGKGVSYDVLARYAAAVGQDMTDLLYLQSQQEPLAA